MGEIEIWDSDHVLVDGMYQVHENGVSYSNIGVNQIQVIVHGVIWLVKNDCITISMMKI